MDQVLRLNEFFVEGGKQGLSHVLLHITEPSTPEEAKKGYFFALCEINNGDPVYITKLQDLIDRAENEYYDLPEEEGKDIFETVLEKMNSEAYVLEKVKDKLNCIVGAIRQKEIIFSYFGHPHLLLFYKNKQALYEKIDLIKNNANDETDENLFSQIVQGKLSPNDYLFVGTPHITDFFSHDRLEKIITTRSAQQSAEHIEKVLAELKNGFSFGGMIINLFQPEFSEMVKKSPAVVQGSASGSLNNLFQKEQSTADTLSPSILPRLDKIKTILKQEREPQLPGQKVRIDPLPAEINSAHVSHRQPKLPKEDLAVKMNAFFGKTWELLKIITRYLAGFFVVLYSIIYGLLRSIILLSIVLVNYQNRRTTILEGWKMSWRGFKKNLVHLPLTTKILFFGSILVAVGFVSSLFYIRYKQQVEAKQAAYNKAVNEINLKISSIESGIIYKSDTVMDEYRSAKGILPQFCSVKEGKADCEKYSTRLDELKKQINKEKNVDPILLADWSISGGPKNIIRLKNKLIGYSPATSTFFVFDLLSKSANIVPTYQTITGFTEAAVPKENDYAIFLYNKKLLMQVEPNELAQKLIDISFSGNAELASMVLYNRRLYSLDALNSTIYRHDSIKTGFGQGKDWSKSKVDLKSGTDMAVDGDIFVSSENGQIVKFTSGVASQFNIPGLDPVLSSGTRLWTYTDVPYLYILDAKEKRLIIAEKNGVLVSQLVSPKFVNPTGLYIDYTAKIVYIVDSGKLFSINLP